MDKLVLTEMFLPSTVLLITTLSFFTFCLYPLPLIYPTSHLDLPQGILMSFTTEKALKAGGGSFLGHKVADQEMKS